MGVDYYQCSECGESMHSDYVDYIPIEGYKTVAMCKWCREKCMDTEPRWSLDLEDIEDIEAYLTARETDDSENISFKTFEELRTWVLDHIDHCVFGAYHPTNHEEAEEMLRLYEADCRRMAWEDIDDDNINVDNTTFKPKREWLESERDHIVDKIEQLKCKKIKLDSMLSK